MPSVDQLISVQLTNLRQTHLKFHLLRKTNIDLLNDCPENLIDSYIIYLIIKAFSQLYKHLGRLPVRLRDCTAQKWVLLICWRHLLKTYRKVYLLRQPWSSQYLSLFSKLFLQKYYSSKNNLKS